MTAPGVRHGVTYPKDGGLIPRGQHWDVTEIANQRRLGPGP